MFAAGLLGLLFALPFAALPTHQIPARLRGNWVIARLIPTRTISCWGRRQANRLLGTSVHYGTDSLTWKSYAVPHASMTTQEWTAKEFSREYCGGGPVDSCVDFHQLSIHAQRATVLSIHHPPANITGGTVEIPGDWVLLKNSDTIVISVCNLYFEAHRR